ncbi:MAG: hypothetical protein M3069_16560 [Chloroflexota bacterium]|nr:hypothetical protein [Chloroflexota bacterium]
MKYMLMLCGTHEDRARQESLTAEIYKQEFEKVMHWLQQPLGPGGVSLRPEW